MKGIDEYVSTLTDLGLSTTQAKLYLALAKLDGQTAQEISRTAEVARSDVYRVLAELEEAGFVEKIISKPERFRSISVDDLVSNLIQKRIKETAELQKKHAG
jgi:sugar-specific transcriptional regulator TrmB